MVGFAVAAKGAGVGEIAGQGLRAANSFVDGGYGLKAAAAFDNGEYGSAAGYTLAGTAYGLGNVLTLGEGAAVTKLGTSLITKAEGLVARGVEAGEAGAFSSLKGVKGDGLTAHHMPQAAAGRTGYNEGGALVMTHGEHVATRTYGSKGVATLQSDAGLSFRQVLFRDIQDVRRIVGSKYNEGLRDLIDYYRKNFPDQMSK